jgi:Fur family ferric uptake transcriptional regulator
MNTRIDHILRQNQLSVTGSRKKILELFLSSTGALAHSDIEKGTGEKFDRVTIYRTLHTFLEKGIIHTIPTDDNSVLYALCNNNCHVHFVCSACGTTTCLADVMVPPVQLPKGFLPEDYQMVVKGLCKECR